MLLADIPDQELDAAVESGGSDESDAEAYDSDVTFEEDSEQDGEENGHDEDEEDSEEDDSEVDESEYEESEGESDNKTQGKDPKKSTKKK